MNDDKMKAREQQFIGLWAIKNSDSGVKIGVWFWHKGGQ